MSQFPDWQRQQFLIPPSPPKKKKKNNKEKHGTKNRLILCFVSLYCTVVSAFVLVCFKFKFLPIQTMASSNFEFNHPQATGKV